MSTRRHFLPALSAPLIIPGSALGLNGATAPSERVTLATVGLGWMGTGHIDEFLKCTGFQYVAVADIDDHHLTEGKAMVDKFYGDQGCAAYHAFEEILLRRDIDAVSIAVPDHWHALVSIPAARAGKAVYSEKPIAHNFNEGRAMVEAQYKYKTVWQTGSWQRSRENFRKGCELVRNGAIGKVHTCEVGLPQGHSDFFKGKAHLEFTDPPKYLAYDRWLGPAPERAYCQYRIHKAWRWFYDYGGGQLMDWVGHHVDIAHWGLGLDETGPLEVTCTGEMPPRDALYNTATRYRAECLYPGGLRMIIAGGHGDIRSGTKWIGDKGWVWVDRGKIEASDPALLTADLKLSTPLAKSPGHYQEFINSVRTKAPTLTPANVALRSATPGFLANISMFTGRKIQWDPVKMEIKNDAAATALLGREMREPYRI